MQKIIVVGATGQCDGTKGDHRGKITFSKGSDLLTVTGSKAVVVGDETDLDVATCKHEMPNPAAPPPKIAAPCTKTQRATDGISRKLTVRSQGVLLESATGPTKTIDSAEKATWKVTDAAESLLKVAS